jgi:hypothetical protein
MRKTAKRLRAIVDNRPKRNDSLYDNWSIMHLISGIGFGWIMPPFIALALLVLWEPLEILVLSPILAKYDIVFGYETIRNSLSDIFFDTIGVLIGTYFLARLFNAPFHLFY